MLALRFVLFSVFLLSFLAASAQPAKQNPDSLLQVAISLAAGNKWEEALEISRELMRIYPENLDYSLTTSRIYTWKGDYDNAISSLIEIHEKNPGSYEVLEALTNACLLSGNNNLTIQYCDLGISTFSDQQVFFLLRKATALSNVQKDTEALKAIDQIFALEPGNAAAIYILTTIYKKKKNLLTLSYQNTSFSPAGTAPWHLGFVEYKRNFTKAPTVFRVNYGYLFSRSGLLYEADVYPRLSRKSYLYLNAGFSSGENIFPQVRAGAEYYRSFSKKLEASLGARFLKFEAQDVTMLTGNVAFFQGNWAASYRPFLAFINDQSYLSNGISIKSMNEVEEEFVQFDVQYGIVPYTFFFSNEINRTGTFRLGVQYQWRIGHHFFLKPFLLYEYEEYVPDTFRNRFNVQLTLSKRF